MCESKLDKDKEIQEKRHEGLKEFVQKTKDMLESRCEQVTQYEEKFKGMNDTITLMKDIINKHKDKVQIELID